MSISKYGVVLMFHGLVQKPYGSIRHYGAVTMAMVSRYYEADSQDAEDAMFTRGVAAEAQKTFGLRLFLVRFKDFAVDKSGESYAHKVSQWEYYPSRYWGYSGPNPNTPKRQGTNSGWHVRIGGLWYPYDIGRRRTNKSRSGGDDSIFNNVHRPETIEDLTAVLVSDYARQPLPYDTQGAVLSIDGFQSHLGALNAISTFTQKAGAAFPQVDLWRPGVNERLTLHMPAEVDDVISIAANHTVRIANAAHVIQERISKAQQALDGRIMHPSVGSLGDRAVTANGSIVVKTQTGWEHEGYLLHTYAVEVEADLDHLPLMQYGVDPPTDDARLTNEHKYVQDNGAVWDYDEDSQDGWVRSSVTLAAGPSGRILKPDDFAQLRGGLSQEIVHLYKSVELEMEEELLALDPGQPNALDAARGWHKHRLSTAAAQKRKDILAAVSEQGVSLPAHCVEQSDAETEVARLLAKGSLDLDQSDRLRQLKRTEARYKRLIRSVKVLKTPDWFNKGVSLPGDQLVYPWQSFTTQDTDAPLPLQLKVANPKISEDLGPIGLTYQINGRLQTRSGGRFKVESKPRNDGTVPVLYVNPQGVDNDPPHGIYRLDIDARNICGPDRVTIDIVHPRPLIEDPEFQSIGTSDAKWTVAGAALAEAKELKRKDLGGAPGPRDEDVLGRILRLVDNDKAQERFVLGEKIPIARDTRYDVSIRARQFRGDRINYFYIQFFDRSNKPINNASYGYDNDMFPEGWLGVGTFFYWGVMGAVLPKTPETFTHTFGKDGVGEIPPAARSFRVGMIFGWKGTTETELWIEHCQVNELVWR